MLDSYNVIWESPSINSSQSMPCGGGDIGLNVWIEDGDLLFYISRSGTFDENNMFLNLGRFRLIMQPNPLLGADSFRQELKLRDGYVTIYAKKGEHKIEINVWVDVHRPVIHVEVKGNTPITATAHYESWRTANRSLQKESFLLALVIIITHPLM